MIAPIMLAVHRYVAAMVLAIVVALLMFPVSSGLRHLQRIRNVNFVAVSSSFPKGVTFYDLLLQNIIVSAYRSSKAGHRRTYVVFPWNKGAKDADDHHGALNAIPYKGAFIVPAPNTDLAQELSSFPKRRVKIVVDALPTGQSDDADGYVGGDEEEGGKLVAEVVLQHLKSQGFTPDGPVRDPRVLVLLGHTFKFDEPQRHVVARKILEESHDVGHIQFEESKEALRYQRLLARKYLYELLENQTHPRPDVIFATNDDMALGAREALRQLEEEGKDIRTRTGLVPGIVGYDGIPEVIDLINTDAERFLFATIDVKIQEQAETAWRLMKAQFSRRRGPQPEPSRVTITPELVHRGHLRGGDFASEIQKPESWLEI